MKIVYGTTTHDGVQLISRKAIISPENDNENYTKYKDTILIITYADNKGNGYDESMYPAMLCDFKFVDGAPFPFTLYEYEFELID